MDPKKEARILTNAEISEIELAVPPGHEHLRTSIRLQNGEEIVLQEAAVANLVRAYVTVKTHPGKRCCRLVGRHLDEDERKEGFAAWQLLES